MTTTTKPAEKKRAEPKATGADNGMQIDEMTWSMQKEAGDVDALDKMKILISGANGSGKTRCISMFSRPFLGICELQGIPTAKRANPKAVIYHNPETGQPGIRTFRDIEYFVRMAGKAHERGFDAVGLDGITDIQRIIRTHFTRGQGEKAGRDKTSKETWGVVIDKTIGIVRALRDLPIHVAVTVLDVEVDTPDGTVHRFNLSGKGLPTGMGEFFNAVGHVYLERADRGMRRNVLFRAGSEYMTKGLEGLDDIEPPEPLQWIAKAAGRPVPDDVQLRVAAWRAMNDDPELDNDGRDDDDDKSEAKD